MRMDIKEAAEVESKDLVTYKKIMGRPYVAQQYPLLDSPFSDFKFRPIKDHLAGKGLLSVKEGLNYEVSRTKLLDLLLEVFSLHWMRDAVPGALPQGKFIQLYVEPQHLSLPQIFFILLQGVILHL